VAHNLRMPLESFTDAALSILRRTFSAGQSSQSGFYLDEAWA